MDADYLGLTMAQANHLAVERGERVRAVKIDGEYMIVTRDYRLDRLNVVVEDGVITQLQPRG